MDKKQTFSDINTVKKELTRKEKVSFFVAKAITNIQADFKRFFEMTDFHRPDDMDPDLFTENLVEKIDLVLKVLSPGNDLYEKVYMMKGLATVQLANWNKTRFPDDDNQRLEDIKCLQQVLDMAEPIKLKKNGFMLYFETLMSLTFHFRCIRDHKTSRLFAKRAEEIYLNYCSTNTEVPTHCTDFLGVDAYSQLEFEMTKYQIGFIFWQSYEDDRDSCPVEKVAAAIKWIMFLAREKYDTEKPQNLQVFDVVYHMIASLINRHCFRQVDNALAVLMEFSVQYQRNTPFTMHLAINIGKGIISNLYARWCSEILQLSMKKIKGEDYYPVDNETFLEINEPGDVRYKTYCGRFPIEPVDNLQDMAEIFKTGKAYIKQGTKWFDHQFINLGLRLSYFLFECYLKANNA